MTSPFGQWNGEEWDVVIGVGGAWGLEHLTGLGEAIQAELLPAHNAHSLTLRQEFSLSLNTKWGGGDELYHLELLGGGGWEQNK